MSTDVHTLSGAYALDALSPEEAEEFRLHLAGCQACRDEVRELQSAAARMGAGQAIAPPPELKARILAAADRTPQLPPARTEPQQVTPLRGPRRWVTWVGAAAAAAVLITGGALGIRALTDDGAGSLPPTAAAVFEAEDVRTATVKTANGGEITVGVSPSRAEMAVDTRELPQLDSEHVYQLWAVHDGETTSAAVLTDAPKGAAMDLPPVDTQVAVTVEPEGGSPAPTDDPIAVLDPYAV